MQEGNANFLDLFYNIQSILAMEYLLFVNVYVIKSTSQMYISLFCSTAYL